jgi:thiosulfate reductase cytochrome b subunit
MKRVAGYATFIILWKYNDAILKAVLYSVDVHATCIWLLVCYWFGYLAGWFWDSKNNSSITAMQIQYCNR